MLPSILSHELMEGVRAFLRATFPPSSPEFREAFDAILNGVGRDKLFQGPYLRVGLPFQPGQAGTDYFPRLKTAFPPYRHQEQSWARLRTENPLSTLVATGTGSGKTECFLFPILDHVLANPAQRGIKAILLYPMNALAGDQARRFAKLVRNNPACCGKVRIGLYVGGEGDKSKQMTEDGVITCRQEMQKSPPDILMTNYKMLDYLLIRQDDRALWAENSPDTLRYLVVDEIHTFDGAQGTDLACLIRRVKARLKTPRNHICAVGTSATLGGEGSSDSMIEFAKLIFGEDFNGSSVILESRKSAREHIEETDNLEIRYFEPPGPEHLQALRPGNYQQISDYIGAQVKLWFGKEMDVDSLAGRVALGREIRGHNFLRTLLQHFEKRRVKDGVEEIVKTPVVAEDIILSDLISRRPTWDSEHLRALLNSFISLCAHARSAPHKEAYFLQLRSELWMRELSRMVASVHPKPQIRFSMDLPKDHPQRHLAAMHCRECGVMGWGGVQKANEDTLKPELDLFYSAFFSKNPDPRLRFVFPVKDTFSGELEDDYFCGSCLNLFKNKDGTCPNCGTNKFDPLAPTEACSFRVESPQRIIQRQNVRVADKSCPFCESSTGLTIVGSRAASLASVGLSQLFGSPFNDDKKAMAFSDSVQDASHRAGFYSARTYQIVVRTALRQVMEKLGGEVSLAELSDRFPAHWLAKLGQNDFVGTFIPPQIEWMQEFDDFKATHKLPHGSRLPSRVVDRLKWEVIREFGIQCRIGRTLEKSSTAATHPSPEPFAIAVTAILADIHDISGLFSGVVEADVRRLVVGLCERLRTNGGIHHPFLDTYLAKRGDEYLFNQHNGEALPKLPRAGTGNRPMFFATFRERESFERLINTTGSPSWMENWVRKWLFSIIGDRAKDLDLSPMIERLVKAITSSGLWTRHEIAKKAGEYAWSFNPKNLLISCDVSNHACQVCGHQVTSSQAAAEWWKAVPCLRNKCSGHYLPSTSPDNSFFGDLYRRGDIVRMRAAEHTGMLDRPSRERLEKEFMRKAPLSTDVNLLSCTPTMEMGVDVGDLSTVLLCSVPPEQANYLQRVGRGGRRDGNSLALTIATSAAHDLSYYDAPLKMLAGDVRMPAIFLKAPAVLERQLTAFCIDRWIESSSSARIPDKMEVLYIQLSQDTAKEQLLGAFPNALYQFIELNLTSLIEGFVAMFDRDELDKESIDYLRVFIQGDNNEQGSLSYKINSALAASHKDRESLMNRRNTLTKAIASNSAKRPRDEKLEMDLAQMKAERKGLRSLIDEINSKSTLNFLTDEGLIPNYAFPEEGVTLRSIILRKAEADDESGKTKKQEFEHVRPAEAAITELAPGNSFYVEGRKLTIDQISIDKDEYESWHFCRSCSHLEPVTAASENYSECPRCHCQGWRDTSLIQQMLKMRQVFVTAWDKQVRNLDQKDNREPTSFNKQTSIDYERDAIRKSYSLRAEGATFAFDFIDQITLREMNFGEDRMDSNVIQIGGKSLHGIGFQVCGSCGKIQSRQVKVERRHDISCKNYGKDMEGQSFENTFLLYRELKSEAIRLLIPSLNQDEGRDTQSFVAAIHLGLKSVFGGHLNHLKLSVQQLPISGSNMRSQHVFIYDSVPGGTGYLKDLTRNEHAFMRVLEEARDNLIGCPCAKDPTLDGCYQCIKAYRFRFVHNQISRSTALHQIEIILANRDAIEERSPDEALINPLLESELERRFIEALRQTDGFHLNPEVVDGRPGYLLKIGNAAWKVIPQVELGTKQGIALASRPDFILKPLRPSKGLPIAVFLDGFAYHADTALDNNRIASDLAKRNAIRMSGNYLVWSLTWADLKGQMPPSGTLLAVNSTNIALLLKALAPELSHLPLFNQPDWNSWQLLLAHLSHMAQSNEAEPIRQWQSAASIVACNSIKRMPTDEKALHSGLERLMLGKSSNLDNVTAPTYTASTSENGIFQLLAAVPVASLQMKCFDAAICAIWFDDTGDKPAAEFQQEWQELLRMNNLLQFTPRYASLTRLMVEKGLVSNVIGWLLGEAADTVAPESDSELTEAQCEELELLDPSLQPVLVPLLKSGSIPWPEFGYEATDKKGRCGTSMIEVAWPLQKIGIALPSDEFNDFEQEGWTILPLENLDSITIKTIFNPRA
jgi:DEAD/DEAH box helicase domain-containing protein